MKTKNNLTTGILLGIGVIVLPLILMSGTTTTYVPQQKNKYEIHISQKIDGPNTRGFLLNTETGETWFLENKNKFKHVIK